MLKVKVIDLPVFHNGKRYEKDSILDIDNAHLNDTLFEVLEEVEDNPFKGVREASLLKGLEEAGVVIPEEADRETLIQLFIDNTLSL